jgi:anti-sigma regulatory factor (Ser/Thr protein kinase)
MGAGSRQMVRHATEWGGHGMESLIGVHGTVRPAGVSSAGHVTAGAERVGNSFHHEALFYGGKHGFLEGTLPLVNDTLAAGERVLVAVGEDNAELLKQALGRHSELVSFTDIRILGRNPARIIPAWERFLSEGASENRPALGIGEPIWAGRSPAELTECQRHESLLNLAFDGGLTWRLLCPYDVDGLDEDVIEEARRSHPFVAEDGGSRVSAAYAHPDASPGPFGGTLLPPPTGAEELAFTGDAIGRLRQLLSEWASELELGYERTEHLVLAVTELASNSVHHGGGRGTLRMWRDEETLLVEVHDRGHIEEPLVGRTRPGPEQPTGRGLWLVNQLCDLVQIRSAPTGSVVRVYMRLA